MQFHIHKKNDAPLGSTEPRGYAPLHEARPLEELEDGFEQQIEEEIHEEHGWRSSRRVPVILFIGALLLFLGITYIAKQFQSEENLQGVVVEGNGSLLTSEVLSLAAIDAKQKFYDIDLRIVE